ncbi:4-(cytidine 5'-diphospho)-2-C-methyl-D-erythritol kinase [Alcanivorax sp. S6407]|uniref:4-(cytidine 5'-diphospho)-2-C-methyl-D-erythritol kinase n=1 Tax=Alcanivorax sp. S6407 TaxID=2926424 RepID=UPI001FF2D5D9|nr:4-(cytidine 5'-diphospho)-2-C-methyl-D-erythritol kinase [Alcanivorax sp. S6407]MCK0154956.1 4-(cytidine 5'-diphospho)-2-C-methyl-D-erythritol kinase [Alcanivorax sp. S6407]
MTLILPAPAKLNLFLHITGRRDDGYHCLQTLFALLDHGDTLTFEPAETLQLHCDNPDVPCDDSNLILRAATILQQHTGSQQGARISLTKRLPMGGGVGGGSSDAATALLGLNQLWGLELSLDTLARLGLSLGADVPVFVHGKSAWAEGVGEQITPVSLPNAHFLVIHPEIHVSTARIFGDRELTRDTPISKLPASLEAVLTRDFHNDCEAVAKRHFPEIGKTLDWLRQHTGNARMTGTGACCFARLTGSQQGQQLLQQLPQHWTGFVARSRNTSPLHEALARFRETQNSGESAQTGNTHR